MELVDRKENSESVRSKSREKFSKNSAKRSSLVECQPTKEVLITCIKKEAIICIEDCMRLKCQKDELKRINKSLELKPENENDEPKETLELKKEKENDATIPNGRIPLTVKIQKRLRWTDSAINKLLEYFPHALDLHHKIPSVYEVKQFLATVQDDQDFSGRTEPQVRVWLHSNRNKLQNKDDRIPQRNRVPLFIYQHFNKYIHCKTVPSARTCGEFLMKFSSIYSHFSIEKIQNWIKQAIKF